MFGRTTSRQMERNGQAATKAEAAPTVQKPAEAKEDRLCFGVDVKTGLPFSFPLSLLGCWHIRGMSGCGKTSLTIISLVAQLIALGFPVFIVDLGGDISAFHNTWQLAKKYGRQFSYLTLDPLLKSFHFPPVQTIAGNDLVASEVCQRLLRAFNLDFGSAVYGAAYFMAQALAAMLSVSDKVFAGNVGAGLEQMDYQLNRPENRKAFKDADSVRMNVRFMLQYPQLTKHEDDNQNINVQTVIEQGGVAYFFLPTLDEPIVGPLTAGLAYSNIVHVASMLAKTGRKPGPIFVIGDEAQETIGRSLGAFLVQVRKYGIRPIFANQSTSQLNAGCDLRHVMFEGTTVKQYFTCVGDEDTEVLQSLSRDKRISLGGSSVKGISTSVSFRDEIVRTLERDEILDVSATMGRSFFILNTGKGHAEPYVVQQVHEYPDLSEVPMPMREVARADEASHARATAATAKASGVKPQEADPDYLALDHRIQEVIERIQATERWDLLPAGTKDT